MGLFILFWFLTWNEAMGSDELIRFLIRLSLFDRVFDFLEGKINSKDIIFFILFTGFFLFLTLRSLGSRAWKGLK
jgi:ABC-2 type transport system permease protein